jgi:serine phosphatase RsbU (regulator of sigma subunit)
VLQTEIVIAGVAVIVAFLLSAFNILQRRQFVINWLFVIVSFLSSVLFFMQLNLLLDLRLLSPTLVARFYFSLIHFLSLLFFLLIFMYPYEELKPRIGIIAVVSIPSLTLSTVTAWTSLVIYYAQFKGFLEFQVGYLFPVYLLMTVFYLLGALFILIYKSKFALKSKVLRKEIQYISYGLIAAVGALIFMTFFLPGVFGINQFQNIGITLPGVSILIILNYAVFDIRVVDFKRFNIRVVKWIITFLLLTVPVYFFLHLRREMVLGQQIPAALSGLLIFLYLFLFFRFAKEPIDRFFEMEYHKLGDMFDRFFQSISEITISDERGVQWEKFYNDAIDSFIKTFSISNALFYLYDSEKEKFVCKHGEVEDSSDGEIGADDDIVTSVNLSQGILDRSILYTDISFQDFMERVIGFFDRNGLELAMPFYIYGEHHFGIERKGRELTGMLFLGRLPRNRLYSKTFLSALEIYRLQFQRLLASGLVLEDVRIKQIYQHDRLVVEDIKKKIIPERLEQIGPVRVSSLYFNNSDQGGDYFDSIRVGNNSCVIFLSETGYAGVESAVIGLELYSTFHLRSRGYSTPERLLSIMNWVLSTSRFSERHAPALAVIVTTAGEIRLSTAATNPLMIYDAANDSFRSHDTRGVPLGVSRNQSYQSVTITPSSGSIGVIFSSGFESSMNSKGENFDVNRLQRFIRSNRNETPAVLTRLLYREYMDFIGDQEQLEDASVVIIKV